MRVTSGADGGIGRASTGVAVDDLPVAALVCVGARVQAANELAAELLGRPVTELVGVDIAELLPVAGPAEGVVAVGERWLRVEGLRGVGTRGAGSEPGRPVVLCLRDVTGERRHAAIVDRVADATFVIDRRGAVRWRSEALVVGSGVGDEEALGSLPLERVHPEDMPGVLEAFARLMSEPGGRAALVVRSRSVGDTDVWETQEIMGHNGLDDPDLGGVVVQLRGRGDPQRVETLGQADGELQSLTEVVPVGILLCDPAGKIVYRNPAARRLLGEDLHSFRHKEWSALVRPEHRDAVNAVMDAARRKGEASTVTAAFERGDRSTPCWLRLQVSPHESGGRRLWTVVAVEDVTDRVEAEAETARLTRVLDASSDLVLVWRRTSGELLWANRAARALLEVPLPDGSPRRPGDLVDEDDRVKLRRAEQTAARTDDVWQGEMTVRHPTREPFPVSVVASAQRDAGGAVDTVALVARDISDLKAAEERLRHLATHDALTGLANRTLLADRLDGALERQRRTRTGLAVLYCDLDGFKAVNDDLGDHRAGDVVLTEVARRLAQAVREADTLARVGGDEFVLVAEEVEDGPAAEVLADRLHHALVAPVIVGGDHIQLGLSVGAAVVPPGAPVGAEELLIVADRAMYRAKRTGKGRTEVVLLDR